jgi:hypothetical protein
LIAEDAYRFPVDERLDAMIAVQQVSEKSLA